MYVRMCVCMHVRSYVCMHVHMRQTRCYKSDVATYIAKAIRYSPIFDISIYTSKNYPIYIHA